MPRRKVADLSGLVEDADIDEDQHIDVIFIPTEHESSDKDFDCDLDENISSHALPTGSYEHVRSTYTSTQKLLEPNHIYDWQNNALNDIPADDDNCSFNNAPISSLYSKNFFSLFELFFSSSMKNHVIEATSENNFDLSKDDLERFIVIIMITIFNSRKSLRDYWSKKRILQCPVIADLMARNKFITIKKYIRYIISSKTQMKMIKFGRLDTYMTCSVKIVCNLVFSITIYQ